MDLNDGFLSLLESRHFQRPALKYEAPRVHEILATQIPGSGIQPRV